MLISDPDVHLPGRFVDVSGLFAHVQNVLLRDGASRWPPRLSASHGPAGWRCRLDVTWPEPARYEAHAPSKREAARRAKAHMIRCVVRGGGGREILGGGVIGECEKRERDL